MRKKVIINATVIFKETWGGGGGAFVGETLFTPIAPSHSVTFELENRKSITLKVSAKIYDSVSINSTGLLEYSGKKFENFTVG